MSHVDLRAAGSVPGVCGSLKIKLWPRSMATMSGLSVSPVLGVSVIAWLADHVRSGVHAGAGRWELVKKHAGDSCGARSSARLLPFGFPCSNPDPVVE